MAAFENKFETRIRSVLAEHGGLSANATSTSNDANLYDLGMTSHATVSVMLALEGEFDVEFPDSMLNRSVFASIASIRDAVVAIGGS